ncbi:MAG: OmpA family protein [Planctomycetota bacterium]|nr:OmpA family protein [Planctomycetota bacterium]
MRRSFASYLTTAAPIVVGLAFLIAATGCSRSRALDRSKVLEAETINQRQKLATLQSQVQQSHLALDGANAREQQMRAELLAANQEVRRADEAYTQAAEARSRLMGTQEDLRRTESELASIQGKYEKMLRERIAQPRPVAKSSGPAQPRTGGVSPEAEAMRRDLQQRLSSLGVRELSVEIRREAGGEERVAIVLPDAFPSGKATLADNASAVQAVVRVGQLIDQHYKSSLVRVEGHTDSDPLVKTKPIWGTNENLSNARAKAVAALLANAGVGDVSTAGLGASRPLALGNSKQAKARNRRVEIFISPRG